MSSRQRRGFTYTNEDGQEGRVEVAFGPWGFPGASEAPIMVSFDDASWMGVGEAEEFMRWMRNALAEAKRKHAGGGTDA